MRKFLDVELRKLDVQRKGCFVGLTVPHVELAIRLRSSAEHPNTRRERRHHTEDAVLADLVGEDLIGFQNSGKPDLAFHYVIDGVLPDLITFFVDERPSRNEDFLAVGQIAHAWVLPCGMSGHYSSGRKANAMTPTPGRF